MPSSDIRVEGVERGIRRRRWRVERVGVKPPRGTVEVKTVGERKDRGGGGGGGGVFFGGETEDDFSDFDGPCLISGSTYLLLILPKSSFLSARSSL